MNFNYLIVNYYYMILFNFLLYFYFMVIMLLNKGFCLMIDNSIYIVFGVIV